MGKARQIGDQLARANEAAWIDVLRSPSGRRVMRSIIYDICGLERDDYDSSAKLHHIQGQRAVGARILRMLRSDPPTFSAFMLERAQDEGLVATHSVDPEEDPE